MWGGDYHRGGAVPGVRGFPREEAILRFIRKCEFDPTTGCVLWTGAKCWGRGKTIRYGSFKDAGKTHLAHRWSAANIHGFEIDGLQVDHCCPMDRAGGEPLLPNTLCVHHVEPLSAEKNRWLQTERRRMHVQVQVGLLPYHEIYGDLPMTPTEAVPFYEEPEWYKKAKAML